jgi:hypothetical protein
MNPIENKWERTKDYYILKVDEDEYFEDAWEDYGDEPNYSFTPFPQRAYEFSGDDDWDAPKYLWNDVKGESIRNLKQAQEYFGGEIIKVSKTTIEIEKYVFGE